MKTTSNYLKLWVLTLFVACNEDLGSNQKFGNLDNREVNTPPVTTTNQTENLRSSIHREKGAPVLSYADEISKTLAFELSETLYRAIPSKEKDDEGSSLNVITVTNLGRPMTGCGSGTFPNIDARIADCSQKNGEKARWDGVSYGAAGEGTWKLVMLAKEKEIWFDSRTGMVWSDLFTSSTDINVFNWCKASGNTESETPTELINCSDLADGESVCAGSMTEGIENQIKWRLPTRNDFLQADLNGARFVLKPESGTGVWTATLKARVPGRTQAWVYHSQDGTLSAGNLATERQVRCLGVPVR